MKKKLLALGLALAMTLGLAACAPNNDGGESTPPVETPPAVQSQESETPAPEGVEIRLGLLNGPTGMGAAKLLADNDAGETVNRYVVTTSSDPAADIVPKLNSGELDIAALPTNVAANLYNKTGKVQILALNTGERRCGQYPVRPVRPDPVRHQPGHQYRVCAGLPADPERPGPGCRRGHPVEDQRGGHLSDGLR